ncbi:MAG: hypothetical protein ACE5JR_02540 [Gemmatimonadota bacterium]
MAVGLALLVRWIGHDRAGSRVGEKPRWGAVDAAKREAAGGGIGE